MGAVVRTPLAWWWLLYNGGIVLSTAGSNQRGFSLIFTIGAAAELVAV